MKERERENKIDVLLLSNIQFFTTFVLFIVLYSQNNEIQKQSTYYMLKFCNFFVRFFYYNIRFYLEIVNLKLKHIFIFTLKHF